MPPIDVPKGSPADWLRHARSDLLLAMSSPGEDVLLETLCFHVQQSVEKAIKAVLIFSNVCFPRTHNIGFLAELLPPSVPCMPALDEAAALTDYAVSSRYPGEAEDVTTEELAASICIAQRVLAWATAVVEG